MQELDKNMRFPPKSRYLLLSTSLLVDRVFLYSGLVDRLTKKGDVSIWASTRSPGDDGQNWKNIGAAVESFPEVRPFREVPYNYLRRLNEFVWDFRYRPTSRLSMMTHVRNKQFRLSVRALKLPARLLAMLRAERVLERNLEKLLLSYPRSEEAARRLVANRPSVVLMTGPFQFEQPAVFTAAKQLGIPTLAYIPSWDNVTTKNRLVFNYDGYIVWNEKVRQELLDFYPQTRKSPIYVVGAPQFDVFRREEFRLSRREFCENQGLDPKLPIIVFAVGSPNFLKEHHGAVFLAKQVAAGRLGDVQLLVRPHPLHDNGEMSALFEGISPNVRLQETLNAEKRLTSRTQDEKQIVEWVNTFRHADVVVNTASTVTIDAALFDKPVVNLDFDPQPGQADQQLIKDVNHAWPHFKPIAESGGVWLVDDFGEMMNAIETYLRKPDLHRNERKWMVEHVCGYIDGKCGERMADAILEVAALKKAHQ